MRDVVLEDLALDLVQGARTAAIWVRMSMQ
jgi:hypothetical protein